MKSNQKITKVQLNISQDDEYIVLGLVSAEPDYKLSLILNKKLRIALRSSSPVKISDSKNNELSFSKFTHLNSSTGSYINLLSNRSAKNFLFKKLKNIDYVFLLYDPDKEYNAISYSDQLKELQIINAVFNIDLKSFRDKNLQYLTQ